MMEQDQKWGHNFWMKQQNGVILGPFWSHGQVASIGSATMQQMLHVVHLIGGGIGKESCLNKLKNSLKSMYRLSDQLKHHGDILLFPF